MTVSALLAAACVLTAVGMALPRSGDELRSRLPSQVRRPHLRRTRGHVPGRASDRRGAAPDIEPALVLELVAAALAAGAHPAAALSVAGDAVGGTEGAALRSVANRLHLGAGEVTAWRSGPRCGDPLRRALALSSRSGAPASELLRRAAAELRRARRREREAAAQRLGVRMVLPLGLCALPAFAAWGVVPVVLGLARGVNVP